jgi:hypothetical protein
MTAFLDVAPCSLVELTDVSKVFTGSIIRALVALMMEQLTPLKRRVNLNETTQRNIPENSHICASSHLWA